MTRVTHPSRLRILAFLRSNPGASMQDVANHLGVKRTAASHHLRILVQENRVAVQRQGRRILHFTSNAKVEHRSALGFLRQQNVRGLLQAIAANPTISMRALARELDVTPHTVRWHVQRLEREGVLATEEHPLHGSRMILAGETREIMARPATGERRSAAGWLGQLA